MAILFTADTHFGHRNILRHCSRPFVNIQEHDEALIENWNSVVDKADDVYHLGDFGFGPKDHLYRVGQRLNGRIFLIKGNHDRLGTKPPVSPRFAWIKDVHFLKTQYRRHKVEIFLSHYAHRTWPKAFHGIGHLYGHSHGNMPSHGISFDVGVDCWNYMPLSMAQVLAKFEELRTIQSIARCPSQEDDQSGSKE